MSSRLSIKSLPRCGLICAVATLAALSACASVSSKDDHSVGPDTATAASGKTAVSAAPGKAAASSAAATTGTATGQSSAAPGAPVEIPRRAVADFDRAVGMMRAGNATEAELEFKQIAVTYPQLSAPYVNLGILFRKAGRLDQSEEALQAAVERNAGSAVAWTELGATQRLKGKFQDAAASYEKAIAADPNYAPAYRNLGVDSDLYLADPERALTAFQRYKDLTGEDKPVSGWLAELRQRTGKPAVKPAAAPADAPPADTAPESAPAPTAPATAPAAAPATAPTTPATAPSTAPTAPATAPKAGG